MRCWGLPGCGKSTLLRILSGLSQPSSGALFWHGKPLNGESPNVAIVFQSFALFPWLTVLENVEAPLEARGVAAVERRKRALRMLDTVGLDGFETAYPKELSGGMKQRVGFARALVVEPEVLFMDEPFSALDVLTAENLRGELLELWLSKKMPTSAIFIVTHNIEEAVMLADRIVVLGRNPARIRSDFNVRLSHPRDRKSARFVELVDYIYKVMTEPDVEHALPDPESTGEIVVPPGGLKRGQAPVKTSKYQILPHARVGGIAGLVELLHDRGGREDLFRLSEELVMDVEDLLPILEACQLLGFAWLKEGDVQLSRQGVRVRRCRYSDAQSSVPRGGAGTRHDPEADRQHSEAEVGPLDQRRIFSRHSRRALLRRGSAAAVRYRHELGPLRGDFRLRPRERAAGADRSRACAVEAAPSVPTTRITIRFHTNA